MPQISNSLGRRALDSGEADVCEIWLLTATSHEPIRIFPAMAQQQQLQHMQAQIDALQAQLAQAQPQAAQPVIVQGIVVDEPRVVQPAPAMVNVGQPEEPAVNSGCGLVAAKALAVLSLLAFFLSGVAYTVTYFWARRSDLGYDRVWLLFQGLFMGSFVCCIAGCCVACTQGTNLAREHQQHESSESSPLNKKGQCLVCVWALPCCLYLATAILNGKDGYMVFGLEFMIIGFVAPVLGCCHLMFTACVFPVQSEKEERSEEGGTESQRPNPHSDPVV